MGFGFSVSTPWGNVGIGDSGGGGGDASRVNAEWQKKYESLAAESKTAIDNMRTAYDTKVNELIAQNNELSEGVNKAMQMYDTAVADKKDLSARLDSMSAVPRHVVIEGGTVGAAVKNWLASYRVVTERLKNVYEV